MPPTPPSPAHEWHVAFDAAGGISRLVARPATTADDGATHPTAHPIVRLTGPHGAGAAAPAVVENLATQVRTAIHDIDTAAHVVVATAETGDPVAVRILADAGRHLVDSLAAATGYLLDAGLLLREPLERRFQQIRPDVTLVRAERDPLDGALDLAHNLLAGTAPQAVDPWLTITPGDIG